MKKIRSMFLIALVALVIPMVVSAAPMQQVVQLNGESGSQSVTITSTDVKFQFESERRVRIAGFKFESVPAGCDAYAPDDFQTELTFTPFSQVTDWTSMMGATNADTAMQIFCVVTFVEVELSVVDGLYVVWQLPAPMQPVVYKMFLAIVLQNEMSSSCAWSEVLQDFICSPD